MNTTKRMLIHGGIALLSGFSMLTCTEDFNTSESPVELIAHVTEQLNVLDLTDPDCPSPVVAFEIRNIVKQTGAARPPGSAVDLRFLDVLLRSRRRSFFRIDGGTIAPRTYVEEQTALVPANGEAEKLPPNLLFPLEFLREAPFVALLPEAGGRDPETGRNFVRLQVVTEFFGETLAGHPVRAEARFPLTVCRGCGGCAPKD